MTPGNWKLKCVGPRYAWDMRLVSVDSLLRLVTLKESTEDETTSSKIRTILVPMEYTRLDELIDVMFTTAKDVETAIEPEPDTQNEAQSETGTKSVWNFTDSALLERKREEILNAVGISRGVKLIKKSRAMYWSADREFRVAATISKRYASSSHTYWYAYHQNWQVFLAKAAAGYVVLGCMDLPFAFAIPFEVVEGKLDELNTTARADNLYWHIFIRQIEPGRYALLGSKTGNHLDLEPFIIPFS